MYFYNGFFLKKKLSTSLKFRKNVSNSKNFGNIVNLYFERETKLNNIINNNIIFLLKYIFTMVVKKDSIHETDVATEFS